MRQFEKPGDRSLLKELNKAFVAKQNKPISDETDLNFVPPPGHKHPTGTSEFSDRITKDGMLRLVSKIPLTRVKVVFSPVIKTFRGRSTESPQIYFLRKKTGSDLYDLDLNDLLYKNMAKLTIIPTMVTGDKAEITLLNKNAAKRRAGEYTVTDQYYKPQSFSCEVWIGPDKFLYCKTNVQIFTATIEFKKPGHHFPHESEKTTTSRNLEVNPPDPGSDTYKFDIREDNYELMQRITLKLTSRFFTMEVLLPNEKVKVWK